MPQPIREVMTTPVKTLREEQTLLDALTFLHEHKVRHIPIVTEGDRLVGVVTDRDVKRASPSALVPAQREVWERLVKETTLGKIMTRDPITVRPTDRVTSAVRTFVQERIGCLPVVENFRLVGIVTARDLFRAMLELLEKQA